MADHIIRNFDELWSNAADPTDQKARRLALTLLDEAVKASDPRMGLRKNVSLSQNGKMLRVGKTAFKLEKAGRVYVVGGGKASGAMAEEIEKLLGEKIAGGCVSILQGTREMFSTKLVELHESSHPIPRNDSLEATEKILTIVNKASVSDLVICLISGGGSALLCLPPTGISLDDLQTVIGQLQKHGATINELNTVRKHLSLIKGGRLAEKAAAKGCEVISLILSDVVGDPIDVIASGPTAPDTTTFKQAIEVLKCHELWNEVPGTVRQYLLKGADGEVPETPKPGSSIFNHIHNLVIGGGRQACLAAYTKACELKLKGMVLSTMVEGEAREAGKFVAAVAKELAKYDSPLSKPAAVIMGGETTVTVRGNGKGGRNQELALAASKSIEGVRGVVIASMGTDGIDGPTGAAGAIVDGSTSIRARSRNMEADDYVSRNDSNTFFKTLGDGLIMTGPTGTNVNDVIVVVAVGYENQARERDVSGPPEALPID